MTRIFFHLFSRNTFCLFFAMEPPAIVKTNEGVAPVHVPAEATGQVLDPPAGGK